MNEAIRTETDDMPRIGLTVYPDQYEWLKAQQANGRRPRKMSDVVREIIDLAMHADSEKEQGN